MGVSTAVRDRRNETCNDDVCLQIDRSSVAENQQTRASLEQQLREEKEAEIAQLQEQFMRQLATEKERQQQSKEREVAELRRQLETSQRTSAKRVSKPEASAYVFYVTTS